MKNYFQRTFIFYSRIFLGIIFVLASLGKVTDVRGFAVAVSDYDLLPKILIMPFAIILSWTELICGILLIFGVALKWVGAVASGLMGIFLFTTTITFARGLEIDCGCFDVPFFGSPKIGWHTILRNVILLGISLPLMLAERLSNQNNFSDRNQKDTSK